VPLNIPIGAESAFEGVIDLIDMEEIRWNEDGTVMTRSPIAPEQYARAHEWRERLLDAVSSHSDLITNLYLEGKEIPNDALKAEIRKACIAHRFVPVFAGASRRNMGVQPLLDAIIDYLPAPDEVGPVKAFHTKKEEEVDIPCQVNGYPLGLVFKVQYDREAGALCYVRMYSGTFHNASTVYNTSKKKRERLTRLLRMHANKSEPIDSVSAGDIAVFVGLKLAQTGDTLGTEGYPVILEKMHFPEPVISVAIEPKTLSDRDRLKEALEILAREDPTFDVHEDEETGQIIIRGMGELHLDVLVTRVIREFKVQAKIGNPQVTYRESITTTYRHTATFHRIIAGKENTAGLTIEVAPLPRGTGNQYKSLCAPQVYLMRFLMRSNGASLPRFLRVFNMDILQWTSV